MRYNTNEEELRYVILDKSLNHQHGTSPVLRTRMACRTRFPVHPTRTVSIFKSKRKRVVNYYLNYEA